MQGHWGGVAVVVLRSLLLLALVVLVLAPLAVHAADPVKIRFLFYPSFVSLSLSLFSCPTPHLNTQHTNTCT